MSKKEVVESSILNKNISDLEKIELVKQVIELNGELAERKVEYNKRIVYIFINKDKINNIQPIKFYEVEK